MLNCHLEISNQHRSVGIRDQHAEKPEAANNLMKTLAQVFKITKEYELPDDNPVSGIGKLKTKTIGITLWSKKEIRQF